jgi:hypothetical protein
LNKRPSFVYFAIIALTLVAVSGLYWANFQFLTREGGGGDFAVYWDSGRTVLYDNATPYGELASSRSQNTIFGIAGGAGAPPLLLDLPFHVEIFLLPLLFIQNFQLAGAIWMTLLEMSIVITVFFCLRFLRWEPNPLIGAALLLFSIFSVHGLWALILGNAVIISGLLIAGMLLALREDHDELAGILLALATFKFLTVGFLILFIIIWAAFGRRKRLFLPFAMTFVILIAVSFFFFPNWFLPYARAIFANLKYGAWLSPAKIFQQELPFVGERLGWLVSGFFAVVLLVEWWLALKKDFPRIIWTAALTLAITPLLGLPTYPQNYAILIVPLMVALFVMGNRWPSSRLITIGGLLVFLFVILWGIAIFATDAQSALFFPLPVFVILLLYWIRWWVVSHPLGSSEPLKRY